MYGQPRPTIRSHSFILLYLVKTIITMESAVYRSSIYSIFIVEIKLRIKMIKVTTVGIAIYLAGDKTIHRQREKKIFWTKVWLKKRNTFARHNLPDGFRL